VKITKQRILGIVVVACLAAAALVTSAPAANKVSLCHWSKHDATYWRVDVSVNSIPAHMMHGDYVYDGTCDYEPEP